MFLEKLVYIYNTICQLSHACSFLYFLPQPTVGSSENDFLHSLCLAANGHPFPGLRPPQLCLLHCLSLAANLHPLSVLRAQHPCLLHSLCLAANAHPIPVPEAVPPAQTLPASQPVVVAVSLAVAHRHRLMYGVSISPSAEMADAIRAVTVCNRLTDRHMV